VKLVSQYLRQRYSPDHNTHKIALLAGLPCGPQLLILLLLLLLPVVSDFNGQVVTSPNNDAVHLFKNLSGGWPKLTIPSSKLLHCQVMFIKDLHNLLDDAIFSRANDIHPRRRHG
jgi:hypothetical protein